MKTRRPKSYVLEVMVLNAVEQDLITLEGKSTAENLTDFFEHIKAKYANLVDNSDGVPRVLDPQLGHVISLHWERSHFETFMRRVRETAKAARRALDADDEETASSEWKKVYEDLWPTEEEVKQEARMEATHIRPGRTSITRSGGVVGYGSAATLKTKPTTFHGDQ